MRRYLRPIALAVGLLAATSACGGSKYEYVNDSSEGVYFKVPSKWETEDVLAAQREGRPDGDSNGIDAVWRVSFGSQVTLGDSEALIADDPGGTATVYVGGWSQIDSMSTASLRQSLFGFDPLNPGTEPNPDIELVSASELATPDGAHGFRVAINANVPSATDPDTKVWVTRDVAYLFDDVRGRVYVIDVGCRSACYVANRTEIDAVINSFTVDPT